MDVYCGCLLSGRGLRRADQSYRRVLQVVVCLSVIVKPRWWGDHGPVGAVVSLKKKGIEVSC
jgi:hypothetical protein